MYNLPGNYGRGAALHAEICDGKQQTGCIANSSVETGSTCRCGGTVTYHETKWVCDSTGVERIAGVDHNVHRSSDAVGGCP